jgi:uncharacterized protein
LRSNATRTIAGTIAAIGWSVIAAGSASEELILHLAAYSLLLCALAFALDRATLIRLFRPRLSSLALGIAGGVVMALATHALYAATSALLPEVRAPVVALYSVLREAWTGPTTALALCVVIAAEEIVWRGVVLELDARAVVRVALAAGAYAVAQLGLGEPLLVLLGLGCGVAWSAARLWRDDLLTPLATHLVWDLFILFLFPLEY